MSFIAPLFLLGFVFIAGPVIFHLIRQVPRKRVVFSSTELLEETERKAENARQLQNPWLLLLRCLIVALLTFAFARPYFSDQQSAVDPSGIRHGAVIAIDRSASMGRPGIAESQAQTVRRILQAMQASDPVSVFVFSDTTQRVIGPDEWSALPASSRASIVAERIESLAPEDRSGSLELALGQAVAIAQSMREESELPSMVTIHLLSDFASGSYPANLDEIEWPPYVDVVRHPLAPSIDGPNLGLAWAGWATAPSGQAVANLVINASHPDLTVDATLRVLDPSGTDALEPRQLNLQGKASHLLPIELPSELSQSPLTFRLEGDTYDFDNELAVAPTYIPEVAVGLYSAADFADASATPYFVQKALTGLDSPTAKLVLNPDADQAQQAYLIERPLSALEAAQIGKALREGKRALVMLGESDLHATVAALSGWEGWSMETATGPPLLIGEVDLRHPLFAPFADPRYSNFSSIQFWQSVRVGIPPEAPATVLARLDDASPLLIELPIGEGRLLIWASSWRPQASQWALSSKFVPFLHQLLLAASGGPSLPSNAVLDHQTLARYRPLFGDGASPALGFNRTAAPERIIAFQLPPDESQVAPISEASWSRLGLPQSDERQKQLSKAALAAGLRADSEQAIEQRQKVWQWLLWLVIALLAVESLAAIRVARRKEAAA